MLQYGWTKVQAQTLHAVAYGVLRMDENEDVGVRRRAFLSVTPPVTPREKPCVKRDEAPIAGTFISRPNRFFAEVMLGSVVERAGRSPRLGPWLERPEARGGTEEGASGGASRMVGAHVADPGRLEELLVPGRLVYLASARTKSLGGFEAPAPDSVAPRPMAARRHGPCEPQGSRRKTSYDLALVDHEGLLVSVDSRVPNDLVFVGLQVGFFPDLALYSEVRRECAYGESRMDFRLSGSAAGDCLLEVKSVTLVRGGRALFPDAPTARGLRHVRELARAVAQGLRAIVVFVIQREDADSISPNDETDPAFGAGLREAVRSGVEVRAYTCRVALDRICLHREVPVVL